MSSSATPGARSASFHLGDWTVEPSLNLLSRGDTDIRLRPKLMDLLVVLASRDGAVVSHDELIEAVWGRRFIADSALAGAVHELRDALGDDPQQPRYIETIPKRGYRLVKGVESPAAAPPPRPSRRRVPAFRHAVAAVAVAVTVAATTVVLLRLRSGSGAAGAPSVAVLPFENLGDETDRYLAEGISAEIGDRLAALGPLRVISPPLADRPSDRPRRTRDLGGRLGVDAVLHGSVRWIRDAAAPARVRITPILRAAGGDRVLWSGDFERSAAEVVSLQDEIAATVAEHLGVDGSLAAANAAAEPRTTNPEAYQDFLRGRSYARRGETAENQLLSISMLERAVARDPRFAAARTELAFALCRLVHWGFDRSETRRARARDAVAAVRTLAPDAPRSLLLHAVFLHHVEMDFARGLAEARAAEAAGADRREARSMQAFCLRRQGRFDEALPILEDLLATNPYDFSMANEVGITASILGRYELAERAFTASVDMAPDQHLAYIWKAANTLLWTGDLESARAIHRHMPPLARPTVVHQRWLIELCSGRPDAALQALDTLFEPRVAVQQWYYPVPLLAAQALRLQGRDEEASQAYAEAVEELVRESGARPDDFRVHSALGLAYAGLGLRDAALREGTLAVGLCPRSRDAARSGFYIVDLALSHVMLGDIDGAFDILHRLRGVPIHTQAVPLLTLDPRWAPLRSHPRFAELISPTGALATTPPGRS